MTKERQEQFALFHKRIALSLRKNKRFARKNDEQIPNPIIYKQINWKINLFYFWLTFAVIKQNGNLLINPLDAGELFCLQILYNLDML